MAVASATALKITYVFLPFLIFIVTKFHSFLYITGMGITILLRRSNNVIVLDGDKYH